MKRTKARPSGRARKKSPSLAIPREWSPGEDPAITKARLEKLHRRDQRRKQMVQRLLADPEFRRHRTEAQRREREGLEALEKEPQETKVLRDGFQLHMDFRPEVCQQLVDDYISSCSAAELDRVDEAVNRQRKALVKERGNRRARRPGRPEAGTDPDFLRKAIEEAWWHFLEKMSWREVAERRGMSTDESGVKNSAYTLSRRSNKLAQMVYEILRYDLGVKSDGTRLDSVLKHLTGQQLLLRKFGFPFHKRPTECITLVKQLFYRHADKNPSQRGPSYSGGGRPEDFFPEFKPRRKRTARKGGRRKQQKEPA